MKNPLEAEVRFLVFANFPDRSIASIVADTESFHGFALLCGMKMAPQRRK
jgi:hypothetical protein